MLPLLRGEQNGSNLIYSGGNHFRGAIIDGEWKYYYYDKNTKNLETACVMRPNSEYVYNFGDELYNIKNDPKETKNLIQKEKSVALELRKKLLSIVEASSISGVGKSLELDEQTRQQLKSLGYVE